MLLIHQTHISHVHAYYSKYRRTLPLKTPDSQCNSGADLVEEMNSNIPKKGQHLTPRQNFLYEYDNSNKCLCFPPKIWPI